MNAFILFILVISNVVGLIDAYSESRWKAISLNLPASSNHPQRRRSSSFHYCDGLDRALLYGGFYNPDGVDDAADYPDASMILSDAWLYSFPPLSQWTRIYPQTSEPALPKARAEHASTVLPSSFISASDTSYCHVVIHGGLTANPDIASDPKSYLDDLWILSVSISSSSPNNDGNNSSSVNGLHTFTKPIEDSTGSPKPSTRAGHGLLVVGNYLYLIGGYTTKFGVTTIQNTMHKLQLTGSKQSNGKGYSFKAKWQEIPFANGKDGPEFRARATFASDPSTNTIVMFGGERGAGQILSDVWIFDTVSEKWTKIMGYEVRNTLSAAVMYESNFVWYAGSYREVSGSITRTYVYRDSGLGAVAVRTKGTGEREISFKCIDPSSKAEAMWCISGYDELSSPGARFGHSMIIRNGEMILFGGEFINSFSDMWSVSLPNVIALGKVYVPSTSQSTIYFAMATLTLLLFGFMVFVANARRRSIAYRNALAMHSRGPPVPPPPIGVPSNMITLLPTFSYTKGIKPDVSSLFAAIEKEYSKSQDKSNESGSFEKVIPQSSSSISPLPSESKELDINSSIAADVCPICLAEFEEKESLKVLPCSHFFHPSCIDEWLNGHNSCPMCKRYVVCDVRTNETQPIQDPQAQQQQQQQQQSTSIEMGTIQREFSIDVSTTPPQQQQEERQTNNNSTASNTDTAATNSSGGITSIHTTSNNPTSFVSHV